MSPSAIHDLSELLARPPGRVRVARLRGSLGFADPQTGLAYAYVTNRMRGVTADPRDVALREAIPRWRGC